MYVFCRLAFRKNHHEVHHIDVLFFSRSDLDELSLWLRADEDYGHAILFFLIFLTTIRTWHH